MTGWCVVCHRQAVSLIHEHDRMFAVTRIEPEQAALWIGFPGYQVTATYSRVHKVQQMAERWLEPEVTPPPDPITVTRVKGIYRSGTSPYRVKDGHHRLASVVIANVPRLAWVAFYF
jgi:hypothetical protein